MTTIDGALGATWTGEGTHFRVFSSLATGIELCLFDGRGREHRLGMEPEPGYLWHCYVRGAGPGAVYAVPARATALLVRHPPEGVS
jgi:pullulanase/glycogen debranching enzyme